MKKYVIGVDGGGTKTQCALYDADGNEIDIVNWGPTNHELLKAGYSDLKFEMSMITRCILEKNNIQIDQIVKSVFGMAGVDTKEQHKNISRIISDLGYRDFILCNDAFLGIKAGSPDGSGVGVVNGTGCCVAGIDPGGRMLQIGGQGTLTGDLGGGVYLGEQVICSIYNYFFRCGQYTYMIELLPDELKTDSKFDFMDKVREEIDKGTVVVSELNKIVFEAANKGDEIAVKVLEGVGKDLAASVNGVLKELEFESGKDINIVLSGSVNTKGSSPILINKIEQDVLENNKDKDIKLILLDKPPVMGAVIWALEDMLGRQKIHDKFFAYSMENV